MFTGSDSSFISVYVFMTVVWVELRTDSRELLRRLFSEELHSDRPPIGWSELYYRLTRPPPTKYHMTLTAAHRRLTQPLHGLVQDVSICTGVEVCAGFHGSSAGLRKQKTDRA